MTTPYITDIVPPDSVPPDSVDDGRLAAAEALFAACRYEAALASLEGLQEIVHRDLDKFRLYTLLADCHARLEQPAVSLRYALQGLRHSQSLDNASRAEAHYQVGRGYGMMNAETNALEHLLAAHRLYACDNGRVLNGIAICHNLLEEYDQAVSFYQKSREAARRENRLDDELTATANLSRTYFLQDKLQEAADEARFGVDLAFASRLSQQRYLCLCQLLQVYTTMSRFDDARACLEQAIAAEASKDVVKAPFSEAYYGEYCLKIRDLERAEAHLLRALELTVAYPEDLIRTHKLLARLFELKDDYSRALKHHKEAHGLEVKRLKDAFSSRSAALVIEHEVERVRQEQERYRQVNLALTREVEGLAELSRRDALTGLYNRRFLDAYLAQTCTNATALGQSLSVLAVDIDNFKTINDTFSHAVGDAVLKRVAELFTATLRASDVAARYGGEEFIIVLADTGVTVGLQVAEKVRAAVSEHVWAQVAPGLNVTVSLGLAGGSAHLVPEHLLAQADVKLYEAKRSGRNRTVH